MFYCFITILSTIFCNSLICKSFVIEIFYFYTVPGTKHHRFMFDLTFSAMLSFFRHQKDSGRQSIYKGENLYSVSCFLVVLIGRPKKFDIYRLFFFYILSKSCKTRHIYVYCQIHISKEVGGYFFYVHVDKGQVVHQMSTKDHDRQVGGQNRAKIGPRSF